MLLWYELGRRSSSERLKHWAERYGGYWLTISPQDLEQATHWVGRRGRKAVFFGRLVSSVRTVISVPAGVCGRPRLQFLLYTMLGSFM